MAARRSVGDAYPGAWRGADPAHRLSNRHDHGQLRGPQTGQDLGWHPGAHPLRAHHPLRGQTGHGDPVFPQWPVFRKVLLIEYPRKGVWTLAFQTGEPEGEIRDKAGDVVTVFVPTTPNPTSGFVIIVPRNEVIEMDMPVEEGLKLIMSLGVVGSGNHSKKMPVNKDELPAESPAG